MVTANPTGGGQNREEIITLRLRNLTRGAFNTIRRDLSNVRRGLRLLRGGLNLVNSGLRTLRNLAFAAAAGLTAVTAGLSAGFIASAQHAKRIQNIADTYGITADEVQALTNIVNRSGIEGANVRDLFEGVVDAQIKVRAGGEEVEKALDRLGITAGQFLNADIVRQIELIAEGLTKIEDPSLRAATAAAIAEDSFQRYNTVMYQLATASYPSVIRQEQELTGRLLPSQNRRLQEAQVSWRLLVGRLLTFRQTVASDFAPAAVTIRNFLRDWVAQIEGPVTEAIRNLNNEVINFLTVNRVSEEITFALQLEVEDPSPAEQMRDRLAEELVVIKDDITRFAKETYQFFSDAFSSEDTPARREARSKISNAIGTLIDLSIVAIVARLVNPDTYQSIGNAVWDGLRSAVTAQNVVRGRSEEFADSLLSALELLLGLAAGIVASRKLKLGGLGAVIIGGLVSTLVSSLSDESSSSSEALASTIISWVASAVLLASSNIRGRIGGGAALLAVAFTDEIQQEMVAATGIGAFDSLATSIIIPALAFMLSTVAANLVSNALINASAVGLAGSFVRFLIGIFTAATFTSAISGGAIVGALTNALRVAISLAFAAVAVTGAIPGYAAALATRLIIAIGGAINAAAATSSVIITTALRALFRVAFAAIFAVGVAPVFVTALVTRMVASIVLAITAATTSSVVIIAAAVRGLFRLAFATIFVIGAAPGFLLALVVRMIALIITAISTATLVGMSGAILGLVSRAFIAARIAMTVAPVAMLLFTSHFIGLLAKAIIPLFAVISTAIGSLIKGALLFAPLSAALVIGAAVGTFISWLVGEIAVAIGVADSNPVERAMSFFFNNILTNPARVGAAIIAGWKFIGESIAYEITRVTESAINQIIGLINSLISEYNKLPGPFKVFGNVGTIGQVSLGGQRPVRPVVPGLSPPQTYSPRQDTDPKYGPQLPPDPRREVPATMLVDGREMRVIFTDWYYSEGLGVT